MNKTAPFIIQARTLKVAQDTPSGDAPRTNANQGKPPQPIINAGQADNTGQVTGQQTRIGQPTTGRPGSNVSAPGAATPASIISEPVYIAPIRREPLHVGGNWNSRYKEEYRDKILPTAAEMLHSSGVARSAIIDTNFWQFVGNLTFPHVYATMYQGSDINTLQIPAGLRDYYYASNLVIPTTGGFLTTHKYSFLPEQVSRLFIVDSGMYRSQDVFPNIERESEILSYTNRYSELMRSSDERDKLDAYGIGNAIAHEFQRAALYNAAIAKAHKNESDVNAALNGMHDSLRDILSNPLKSDEEYASHYKALQTALHTLRSNFLPDGHPEIAVLNAAGIQMLLTDLNGGQPVTSPHPILRESIKNYAIFFARTLDAAQIASRSASHLDDYEQQLFNNVKEELLKTVKGGYRRESDKSEIDPISKQLADRLLYFMITGPASGLESYRPKSSDIFTRLRRKLAQDKEVRDTLLGNVGQFRPFNKYLYALDDNLLPAAYFSAAKRYLREISMLANLAQIRYYVYNIVPYEEIEEMGDAILNKFDSELVGHLSTLVALTTRRDRSQFSPIIRNMLVFP